MRGEKAEELDVRVVILELGKRAHLQDGDAEDMAVRLEVENWRAI